ncbi:MAG TPA: SMC family ATPase, partial [Acidimicrobiales bacterium]|nr:SMC family ATPase [Acidimicrobiales bacterium]
AAVGAAEAARAGLPERATLEACRRDHLRRRELAESVARGRSAAAGSDAAVAAAATALDAALGAAAAARAELERVRVVLRARALVPELVEGEPCPVCGQDVHQVPAQGPPVDLAVAEAAVAGAEVAVEDRRRLLAEAQTHRARVEEKLARVGDELAAVDGRLDGAHGLDAVDAELARVDAAAAALDEARRAERTARAALAAAAAAHEALRGREADARRDFDAARDAVAVLGPPPAGRRDLAADWEELVRWASERSPVLAEEVVAHRRAAEAGRGQVAARLAAVAAACEAAGVDVDPSRWPGEAVAAARARAEADVARLDDQIDEAARLRAERDAATEQHQVADLLAGQLAANRFEKWLLDEALQQLVATASTLLSGLSGGAYALAVDRRSGGFAVVDHTNAGQLRSARTLSGGETFLASLALALALADQVAGIGSGGSARLESLFLDEGFGTLDSDTLDVVATALDELGAGGRMVGVVTHVRELAERLPVRYEVRKVGGSAQVERVEA